MIRVGDYKLIKGMPGLMDGYFGDLHMAQANFLKGGERMNYNYDFAAIMGYAAGAVDDVSVIIALDHTYALIRDDTTKGNSCITNS